MKQLNEEEFWMKKYLFLPPLMLLTLFLSSCGSKAPTEKQLKEMIPIEVLQYEIDGELRTSIIDDIEIVRQQTGEKSDISDCIVKLTDDYLNRTVYITINSAYWDKGGWMIDSYSITQPEKYEFVDGVIYNKDNFIVELTSMGFNYSEEICDVEEQGYSSYIYQVSDNLENLSYNGSVYATATLHQSCSDTTTVYYWEQSIDTTGISYEWLIIGNWHAENIPAYNDDFLHKVDIAITNAVFKPCKVYGIPADNYCEYQLIGTEQSTWGGKLINSPKTITGAIAYEIMEEHGNTPFDMYLEFALGYYVGHWGSTGGTCTVEIYPTYAQIAGGDKNLHGSHGKFITLEKIK